MTSRMIFSARPPRYAAAAPTNAAIIVVAADTTSAMTRDRCRPCTAWA